MLQPEELPCLSEVNEEGGPLPIEYDPEIAGTANGKSLNPLNIKNNHEANDTAQMSTTFINAGAKEKVHIAMDDQKVVVTSESSSV